MIALRLDHKALMPCLTPKLLCRYGGAVLLAMFLIAVIVTPARADVGVIEVPAAADPSRRNVSGSTRVIQIYGTIKLTDPADLEKLIRTIPNFGVSLNSVGGNVEAALALGRTLRREDKHAVVGPDDVCISACVLVLAGATYRAIFGGAVGIHRPFVEQDSAITPEQQKTQYEGIERTVRAYLLEMNVDGRLYDDMFRISPANVKYLTSSEMRAYGLEGSDPYMEQAAYAQRAKDFGISTQELLRRQNDARVKCKHRKADFGECFLAIELGISDAEYAWRERIAQSACAKEASRAEWVRCHDRIIHDPENAK